MGFAYDTWGSSWSDNWGISWGGSGPSPSPSPSPAPSPDLVLLGGGPGYEHVVNPHIFQYRQEELRRKKLEADQAELRRIDEELAEAERKRLERHAKKLQARNAAKEAALEARLQEEINRLRNERIWLMRLIDDEEAALVLLLSLPFN